MAPATRRGFQSGIPAVQGTAGSRHGWSAAQPHRALSAVPMSNGLTPASACDGRCRCFDCGARRDLSSPASDLPMAGDDRLAGRPSWRADLVVLDGSYYLPAMQRDAAAEYLAGHIPGPSVSTSTKSPTTRLICRTCCRRLPTSRRLLAVRHHEHDTIVAYDGHGMFSSPRVWFTFRLFGVDNVFILEGGLPRWKVQGRPLENGPVVRSAKTFVARRADKPWPRLDEVRAALAAGACRLSMHARLSAFAAKRPSRAQAFARAACRVPTTCQPRRCEGRRALSLRSTAAGFCGRWRRHRTAGHYELWVRRYGRDSWLALDALGSEPRALYDGSWSEWGARPDLPVATGA